MLSYRTEAKAALMEQATTPRATAAPMPVSLRGHRRFPGRADQVREARQFLSRLLGSFPATDDAVLCLSELASNAVLHSNSGKPGGTFVVRADIRQGSCLHVEISDQGGPWSHPVRADGQHGRGLLIVGHVARDWGVIGDGQQGWTVWFEISHPAPAALPTASHARQ